MLNHFQTQVDLNKLASRHYFPGKNGDTQFFYDQVPAIDVWRLFIPVNEQTNIMENGYVRIERREPGFTQAMYNAFRYVNETMNDKLNITLLKNINRIAFRSSLLFKEHPAQNHSKFAALIQAYHRDIQQPQLADKLNAILDFCSGFAKINLLRTFDLRLTVLILNRELIRHGFSPAILNNPFNLISHTPSALFGVVLSGMETFQALCSTKQIPSTQDTYAIFEYNPDLTPVFVLVEIQKEFEAGKKKWRSASAPQ
jgi:hypothetical protein